MPPTKKPDETPAKPKAATNGGHLPVLPPAWHYRIEAVKVADTGTTTATVVQSVSGGEWVVTFETFPGEKRSTHVATFPDALRAVGKGVRALDQIAKDEAAVAKAREAALSVLGEPAPSLFVDEPGEPEDT